MLFFKRGLTINITQRPTSIPTRIVVTNFPHNGIRSKYKTKSIILFIYIEIE
jgi:hypothetical protein